MKSDKELLGLCTSDDVLPDIEVKYNNAGVFLTVIKDAITQWNSTYYTFGAMHDTGAIHKRGICREFNMQPAPSTQQWEAASKLCKLLIIDLPRNCDLEL